MNLSKRGKDRYYLHIFYVLLITPRVYPFGRMFIDIVVNLL